MYVSMSLGPWLISLCFVGWFVGISKSHLGSYCFVLSATNVSGVHKSATSVDPIVSEQQFRWCRTSLCHLCPHVTACDTWCRIAQRVCAMWRCLWLMAYLNVYPYMPYDFRICRCVTTVLIIMTIRSRNVIISQSYMQILLVRIRICNGHPFGSSHCPPQCERLACLKCYIQHA